MDREKILEDIHIYICKEHESLHNTIIRLDNENRILRQQNDLLLSIINNQFNKESK